MGYDDNPTCHFEILSRIIWILSTIYQKRCCFKSIANFFFGLYGWTNKDFVSTWAQESWNYELHSAYAHVDGTEISSGDSLSDDYLEEQSDVVKKCLGMGGIQLAQVLELALGMAEEKKEEELSMVEEQKEEMSWKEMSALRGALSWTCFVILCRCVIF